MRRNIGVVAMTIVVTVFFSRLSQAADYKLDLGATGTPATAGFITAPTSPLPFNTVASPTYALGGGLTLSFTSVNNYNLGNTSNPLVTDGLFVTSNAGGAGNFTLSGLAPGSTVTLYAINAWDGNGRAAFVSFNGGTFVDLSHSPDFTSGSGLPGTSPSVSDFRLVASNVVAIGTSLSGTFSNSNGVTTRLEGQLGGMIVQIAVPEPGSIGVIGLLVLACVRRRVR